MLNYNQDTHRQRTVNWADSTGGTAAAFDFTTKGAPSVQGFDSLEGEIHNPLIAYINAWPLAIEAAA